MCNIKPYTDAKTEIRVEDAAILAPMKKYHANQQLCRPVADWLSKFNAPFSCSLLEIFSVYWTVNHPLIAITITITITHGSSLLKWIEKYVIEINGFIIMKFDWFQNWLCAGKVYQLTFWLSNSQWKMMLLPFIEQTEPIYHNNKLDCWNRQVFCFR